MLEEFDIEKVESLDYDKLKGQLGYIFQSESDIVNFINFLKNIYKFVALSDDKRHTTLVELTYFKSQIQLFEKKIQFLIDKKKSEQLKASIKRAKGCGEKITENVISYYQEEDGTLEGLNEVYAVVSTWLNYLNDLYFVCKQTDKNVGGFGN